jgi:hypothetical protein
MRAWSGLVGAILLGVLVAAASLLGGRTDTACQPAAPGSVEALFAPCLAAHAPAPGKVAGRSFEDRWQIAAGQF